MYGNAKIKGSFLFWSFHTSTWYESPSQRVSAQFQLPLNKRFLLFIVNREMWGLFWKYYIIREICMFFLISLFCWGGAMAMIAKYACVLPLLKSNHRTSQFIWFCSVWWYTCLDVLVWANQEKGRHTNSNDYNIKYLTPLPSSYDLHRKFG